MRNKTRLTLLDLILTRDTAGLVKKITGFKFQTKKLRFVTSNNYFDVHEMRAVSYNHWVYFTKIDSTYVFNDYRYSVTTAKHQREMRDLLSQLEIHDYITIRTPSSLASLDRQDVIKALHDEKKSYEYELSKCKKKTSFKRSSIEEKIQDVNYSLKYYNQYSENNGQTEDDTEEYGQVSGDSISSPTVKGLRLVK